MPTKDHRLGAPEINITPAMLDAAVNIASGIQSDEWRWMVFLTENEAPDLSP